VELAVGSIASSADGRTPPVTGSRPTTVTIDTALVSIRSTSRPAQAQSRKFVVLVRDGDVPRSDVTPALVMERHHIQVVSPDRASLRVISRPGRR